MYMYDAWFCVGDLEMRIWTGLEASAFNRVTRKLRENVGCIPDQTNNVLTCAPVLNGFALRLFT